MSTTVFRTRRLHCRRWQAVDFEALFAVHADPEAMRWVGDGLPLTRDQCKAWFEVTTSNYAQRGYGMFTLEESATGWVIGFCGLVHPGGQAVPEVKYAFRRSQWGASMRASRLLRSWPMVPAGMACRR
jgi:[ribosomal protein S5]-alanine N-acetyltransferase